MIIINNQPVNHSTVNHMIGNISHSESILSAMDNNQDVFNYPSVDLLAFSIRLRSHIVDSAQQLSKSDVKFATFYGSRCNEHYWKLTNEGGFLLKPNIKPSEAILDIFTNSKAYAFECATAMVIVLLRAALGLLGEARFNPIYQTIYLWDWHHQDHLPLVIEPIHGNGVPGDIIYFKNPQVNPRMGWWQGENAIVLPNNHYYGHGVGIQTSEDVINILNKYRRPGASESAYLLHRATRVDISQLYLLLGREMTAWTRNHQVRSGRRRPSLTRPVIRPI
jgi:protein-glutamine gamma-glutamyltransferase